MSNYDGSRTGLREASSNRLAETVQEIRSPSGATFEEHELALAAETDLRDHESGAIGVTKKKENPADEILGKMEIWKEYATLSFRYSSFIMGVLILLFGMIDAANEEFLDISSIELITTGCGMMVCAYLQKWPKVS